MRGRRYSHTTIRNDPASRYPCDLCVSPATGWDHCHRHGVIRGALCTQHNAHMRLTDSGAAIWCQPTSYIRSLLTYAEHCMQCVSECRDRKRRLAGKYEDAIHRFGQLAVQTWGYDWDRK